MFWDVGRGAMGEPLLAQRWVSLAALAEQSGEHEGGPPKINLGAHGAHRLGGTATGEDFREQLWISSYILQLTLGKDGSRPIFQALGLISLLQARRAGAGRPSAGAGWVSDHPPLYLYF